MVKLGLGASLGIGSLVALGITLFIFRDKISGFFSDITGGVKGAQEVGETVGILNENLQGNLTGLQDIVSGKIFENFKFPELPSFNFEFPSFEFPTFGGVDFGLDKIFDPIPTTDITETPAAIGRASDRGRITDVVKTFIPEVGILENLNVQTDVEGNQFSGGGVSFIGGTVRETPITGESTLGFIIDKLGVTASQAADIRARAADDFGDFDFGTNTGFGIGSVSPIPNIGQTSGGFEGLTPEQIALRLTGGVISNF